MKKHLLLPFLLFLSVFAYSQTEHYVSPSAADPNSGAPTNNHFLALPTNGAPNGKLLVFFPGTGGIPFVYREFVRNAGKLGYHGIGLSYPNDSSVNEMCINSMDTTCHHRARLEAFDGQDRHPSINIDTNNCIQTRLIKLLQYSHQTYPFEGWDQYFVGDSIIWEKIRVAGHSQGGGHAAIIGRIRPVDRVIMIAWTDWLSGLNRPADWFYWPSETPPSKYYGFIHDQDDAIVFPLAQLTWAELGLGAFGPVALGDTGTAPWGETHQLYTQVIPSDSMSYHGCSATDLYTPMNGNTPVLAPIWSYLLDYEPQMTSRPEPEQNQVHIWPNPFSDQLKIEVEGMRPTHFQMVNTMGQVVKKGEFSAEISTADLPAGVYFFGLMDMENRETPVVVKLVKQ